jgi:nickel-dependent lactate racemase
MPWHDDSHLDLEFPDSWDVTVCTMKGQDLPKLTDDQMRAAFAEPIGTPRLAELARDRKEVVIIFDDLSRPTKTSELVPYILKELKEGGVEDGAIRFVAGTAMHPAMRLDEFRKKLGQDIPRRFPVFNHNPFDNCTYLGRTSRGTPVLINSEVMACDLKVLVGDILPHRLAGFGGGAKMILPGVAHADTAYANHHDVALMDDGTSDTHAPRLHPSVGFAKVDENVVRLDMEEGARMTGVDFIVNAVVNLKRDTVGLFVGDLVVAHREGVEMSRSHYATEAPGRVDIVVGNAYAKANEAAIGALTGAEFLKETGGDIVVVANAPEGQIWHYMVRNFGKTIGGRLYHQRTALSAPVRKLIVLSAYMERASMEWFGPPEHVVCVKSWPEALDELMKSNGPGTRVAVIPDATMQYFPALS